MHFYDGLLIAPLLLLAAVTGLLYACSWQAEKIVYADELTVAHVGVSSLPLSARVTSAKAAAPGAKVTAVRPAPEAADTTRVVMEKPGLAEGQALTVFVDPYTADVRGRLITVGDALPLRARPSEFHSSLQLPFQRGPERRSKGLGLGLAVVRAITLTHHGKVTATPRPGGGLTVRVDLPLRTRGASPT